MPSTTTDILEYGLGGSSSGVLAKLELDHEHHGDEYSVSPDKTAFYLFHGEPGVVLKALADTIGGACSILGVVSRSGSYEAYFETTDTEITLDHYPQSFSAAFDGLGGQLIQSSEDKRVFKCSKAPRRCTIKYGYRATLCSHKLPSSVSVGADDEQEVGFRATYTYTEDA